MLHGVSGVSLRIGRVGGGVRVVVAACGWVGGVGGAGVGVVGGGESGGGWARGPGQDASNDNMWILFIRRKSMYTRALRLLIFQWIHLRVTF